jgi:acyl-CoA reductase-like NAD-dependent aldehyde dehydrogenase
MRAGKQGMGGLQMEQPVSLLIGNEWIEAPSMMSVKNPFTGHVVADIHRGSEKQMCQAVQAAVQAFKTSRKLQAHDRASILRSTADGIRTHAEDLAQTIMLESGKPIRDARSEVSRAVITFDIGAGEAERMGGEILPLDIHPAAGRRTGWISRFPIGPIAAVTPFNFPLNLVAHKLVPVIASGCTSVLKPSSTTPLTALKLGQILVQAGIPKGMINIVPCATGVAERLVVDPLIKMLTFTGSAEVGWQLRNRSGKKRISLELGGNAAAIITPRCDIDRAVRRCVTGGYAFAGQICISLQRIYIHESIFNEFKEAFVQQVQSLVTGDPASPDTRVGPMIDLSSAEIAEERIQSAVREGATLETGGKRNGSFIQPAVLTQVPPSSVVNQEEMFAPVTVLHSYRDYSEALQAVNDSRFGLQAGVFTSDWSEIWQAFQELDVGGVIIDDVPTVRVDNYPYGGVKDSGMGREGVRYTMEEMTELKTLVLPTE